MATTNLGLKTINQSDNISPDPINQNMEKLDKLGLDYVTQQGKSGNWRYRRWKSGTYECWGRFSQQWASPSANGLGAFKMSYPITFAEYPEFFVTARQDGNPSCWVGYVEHNTGYAQWYVGGMFDGADLECNVYAIGRVS